MAASIRHLHVHHDDDDDVIENDEDDELLAHVTMALPLGSPLVPYKGLWVVDLLFRQVQTLKTQ